MNSKLHIIVTGEEGKQKFFTLSKKSLKSLIITSSLVFFVTAIAGIKYSAENIGLKTRLATIEEDLSSTNSSKEEFQARVSALEEEKKQRVSGAFGELSRRSQMIDVILDVLDVNPSSSADGKKNSGGPFQSTSGHTVDDLISKVDHDLDSLKSVPLGPPVWGRISSKFGRRVDPLLNRSAFHAGVDIVAPRGTEVKATAAGRVVGRGYNNIYGWFVKIDHGESLTTKYAHNKKLLVNKGDMVKRGQVISLVGNTGRSTGPHVHYEMRYKNKPINPIKFIRVAKYLKIDMG
ncbi:MAG: M23 family metallopeptidase [Thermodesulfobacteriota bacterium]